MIDGMYFEQKDSQVCRPVNSGGIRTKCRLFKRSLSPTFAVLKKLNSFAGRRIRCMKIFPESALLQLEFDKIKTLLTEHCNTEYARSKAQDLRIHTRLEYIELELRQSHEFKSLLQNAQYFPDDNSLNLSRELKLLAIPGAVLTEDQFVQLGKLAGSMLQSGGSSTRLSQK